MKHITNKQELWNHSTPVVFSPLFDWPPKPKAALLELTKRWSMISRSVLFLGMAFLVFHYLMPDETALRSLSLGWVGSIFLRNYLFMLVIAGGLHLYLFTFRLQGSRLKYDPREKLGKSRKFSFQNQVWDNIFWSLASGTTIWSIYEVLYFWGVANGVIATLTLSEYPLVFLTWLLALPLLTSSHFYFIHRLLHWPPLYRTVHILHHRNIQIGPWSGLSMHPVEHVFYISSVLVHFVIPSHPVILLLHLYSRCLGPAFSHAGFEKLQVGDTSIVTAADFHHQLHHHYFECNYGTTDAPWDKWFGTDHDGTDAATIRIRKQRKQRSARTPEN
jgi:sterol desaturase/sphingolipid hydroxylase (fatty acid hydroxylase superfamily)